MILWFIDRFGHPGSYHALWLKAVSQAGLNARDTRIVSLHRQMKGQLLTKYMSRKAPTWIPERANEIKATMAKYIVEVKPRLVVLSAPEALAILDIHPEHATLNALRGSVYWLHGVPFVVTLPITAWVTKVSTKDLHAANFGFESADQMQAAEAAKDVTHEEPDDSDDEAESDSDADTSEADSDAADSDHDSYFYEPVLSPVGQFAIVADYGKIKRILDHGKHSSGLQAPFDLRY